MILLHYCAQFTLYAPVRAIHPVCTSARNSPFLHQCAQFTLSAPLRALHPVCTIARNSPCLHLDYCAQCALSAPALLCPNAPWLHLQYWAQCALSASAMRHGCTRTIACNVPCAPSLLRAMRPACTCTMRSLYATVLWNEWVLCSNKHKLHSFTQYSIDSLFLVLHFKHRYRIETIILKKIINDFFQKIIIYRNSGWTWLIYIIGWRMLEQPKLTTWRIFTLQKKIYWNLYISSYDRGIEHVYLFPCGQKIFLAKTSASAWAYTARIVQFPNMKKSRSFLAVSNILYSMCLK